MDNSDLERELQSRIPLVNLNTPIEKCERLGRLLNGGSQIYIKRDDCLGYMVGGNKIRKLEYIMADVLASGATTVMTVGGTHSNHARVTAMAARRLGLKCVLVLSRDRDGIPSGNVLINKLLDIQVHTVETREERVPKMEELASTLEKKGERVYQIPLGASNEIGCLGFINALKEMIVQEEQLGLRFDIVFIGSSSAGSQAGLELGKRLFGRENLLIQGVSADEPDVKIKTFITAMGAALFEKWGIGAHIEYEDVRVDDTYVGAGYGMSTEKSRRASDLFNKHEGILLDPTYTNKVGAALIDFCERGNGASGKNILFWHTGGLLRLL